MCWCLALVLDAGAWCVLGLWWYLEVGMGVGWGDGFTANVGTHEWWYGVIHLLAVCVGAGLQSLHSQLHNGVQ